ncbi:DUF3090 family protein [Solicola sp. PLA-1-18]|uniref:DUF3090 family protein n=1 Tax=Solicola sp. PLA-1-18 TaxID=3380532 RepID=UPI003B79B6EB
MLIHRYETPTRFVAGTVGTPGSRTFFLQAREGNRLTSVSLEKEQVSVLAERIDELLETALETHAEHLADITTDMGPLDQPIEEEFKVGTMTLAWETDTASVLVEAFSLTDGDEEEEATDKLVVRLSVGAAHGFAERARSVVGAGRERCQFCGGPIDPTGHLCPRANGFRRVIRD